MTIEREDIEKTSREKYLAFGTVRLVLDTPQVNKLHMVAVKVALGKYRYLLCFPWSCAYLQRCLNLELTIVR